MLRRLARHGFGWVAPLVLLLAIGPAAADILKCPAGQLGDNQTGTTLPSTHSVLPLNVASIAFEAVTVSGTSNSVSLQQCCTPDCSASGHWAVQTAAGTFSTNHVINVSDPACQYRFFIVSSTGSGTQDFFFRCGAELR